jgi:phosphatidylinositol 3-kinase
LIRCATNQTTQTPLTLQDLLLYLLQLVQALKFEAASLLPPTRSRAHSHRKGKEPEVLEADSGLAGFITERSVRNPILGTSFYWYLMVECDTRSPYSKMYAKVAFGYMTQLMEVSITT